MNKTQWKNRGYSGCEWNSKEASEAWGIGLRRVQALLKDGRVPGAFKFGRDWSIPIGTEKPASKKS